MNRTTARTGPDRGFTLLELLLAMSIFSAISIAIVTLLARVSEFTQSGTSKTETLDALSTFSQAFDRDLAAVHTAADAETGMPAVRMYCDHVVADLDADGKGDAPIQRLFFVKLLADEGTSPMLRAAGGNLAAKGEVDQRNDVAELAKNDLKATGGLAEVFWTAVPADKQDPAVMTLWRGQRSPVGGAASLLPRKTASDTTATPAERGPRDAAEIAAVASPVMTGVLHFGVEFWSRKTETWNTAELPPKGPLTTWDSTRGILRKGSKGTRLNEGFWFWKSPESADDPTDDTYPRRVRVTLVVEDVVQAARSCQVAQIVNADDRMLELTDVTIIPASDTAARFIKIGTEWIQFEAVQGRTLTGLTRGARGTTPQTHQPGALAHYGRTSFREYPVATFRDAYKDEISSDLSR
ncbi:MAG: hypothetical protein HMLKMBBP_01351 [Planctomycetes bacterium]|nr:hypothetical protein [Planctomycetota bacterium]